MVYIEHPPEKYVLFSKEIIHYSDPSDSWMRAVEEVMGAATFKRQTERIQEITYFSANKQIIIGKQVSEEQRWGKFIVMIKRQNGNYNDQVELFDLFDKVCPQSLEDTILFVNPSRPIFFRSDLMMYKKGYQILM